MPAFNRAIITNKGVALNAKANNGECSIVFTRSAAGSGTYADGYDFTKCTGLKEQKQSFSFQKQQKENDRTVMLRAILTNETLLEGYYINEYGIFARDPDEGEILYSIATAVAGQAEYMPVKATGGAPSTSTIESYVTVSNAANVTITVSDGSYALQEDLDNLEAKVLANTAAIAAKANKYRARSITLPAASWTGEAAPYICRAEVEGVTENNDIQVLPSFAWTQEEAESWAGAMVLSGSQEVNTLILKAYRDKPMVDLTVTVLIGDEVTKGGE